MKPIATNKISSYLYLATGILLTGVGILGIFLPLLPTTIFLILASMCFMKSSPKMHNWLVNNKYLGRYLKAYKYKTGMTINSKISSIALLWLSIGASGIFFTESTVIRIILLLIAVGVTIHLVTIKTARED